MKKFIAAAIILLSLILVSCSKPVVNGGPLVREDFNLYKNGAISVNPDEDDDGYITGTSGTTARNIGPGSSLNDVITAYAGITAAELDVGTAINPDFEVLNGQPADILKDNPKATAKDYQVDIIYKNDDGYELTIILKLGKVDSVKILTPAAVERRDVEVRDQINQSISDLMN
jgi:hypothetical protein